MGRDGKHLFVVLIKILVQRLIARHDDIDAHFDESIFN